MSTIKQNNQQKAQVEASPLDAINKTINKKFSKVLRILLAALLLIVGILGIILPFLHGTSFLIAGFIILSFDFPWIETRLRRYVSKHKTTEKIYNALHNYLKKKFDKNLC